MTKDPKICNHATAAEVSGARGKKRRVFPEPGRYLLILFILSTTYYNLGARGSDFGIYFNACPALERLGCCSTIQPTSQGYDINTGILFGRTQSLFFERIGIRLLPFLLQVTK